MENVQLTDKGNKHFSDAPKFFVFFLCMNTLYNVIMHIFGGLRPNGLHMKQTE